MSITLLSTLKRKIPDQIFKNALEMNHTRILLRWIYTLVQNIPRNVGRLKFEMLHLQEDK